MIYKQRNVVERCFNRLKQWRVAGRPSRPSGIPDIRRSPPDPMTP
ncbi:hypothetical protein [Micromonospora palomenae]